MLKKRDYWKEMQLSYLDAIKEALPVFQQRCTNRIGIMNHEDDISRELYFAIEEILFQDNSPYTGIGLPSCQVYGQPDSESPTKEKREDKCPDLQWTYVDYVNKSRRDFQVECKRLRQDETHHCKEYVINGLKRFTEKEWSYGYNCHMGLMIGYVEGLQLDDCVNKIRAYLKREKITDISHTWGDSTSNNSVHYQHSIERLDIAFSPFELHHYLVTINNE